MKVAFFSNFLNHHQVPFCNQMVQLLGIENFIFVAKMKTPERHLALGYDDCNNLYPYVIRAYESAEQNNLAISLISESEVVIGGDWRNYKIRLKHNKLTFNYSERLLKIPPTSFSQIKYLAYLTKTLSFFSNKNFYLLCAGAFVAKEYSLFFSYPNRKLRWGYFTEVVEYDIRHLMRLKRKYIVKILWAGRFIDWKHPEYALNVVSRLHNEGYKVNLTMVGTGILEEKLKQLVKIGQMDDYVSFEGSMPHAEVRKVMCSSSIFIFTSDRQEGWGAVLNESMNSGCAVVASDKIGAAPYLIKHGENGLLYKDNDENDLYLKLKLLLDNQQYMEMIGRNAYQTMVNEWSPTIAAHRFVEICQALLLGNSNIIYKYTTGPCSKEKR